MNLIGCAPEDILHISAKTGQGVDRLLDGIVQRIPPPRGSVDDPPRALIFDSIYDQYRGVVAFLRVVDGGFKRGDEIRSFVSQRRSEVEEVGIFSPDMRSTGRLGTGEVGYLIAGVKNVSDLRVGDTLTLVDRPAEKPLPGYKEAVPMVFCGLFPIDGDDYPVLKLSLIHISEPTRLRRISYAVFCLKKKKKKKKKKTKEVTCNKNKRKKKIKKKKKKQ